ncbi:hypothetical protein BCR33DRAFT_852978 [Rhizoclosmatium globosum]|uniref:heme oxygenase (biliverdin-producing) n=1 Tax=Rhizoclosmatium globosum TaxID=329046 RepID=A0A1Y2BYR5_9FUNG|nr:hypothetical protein BCR33DRAFT_852978 [Rhizoclosmatium globosum]|eukprot:ORY39814.1 hypothetical protein BCR33DRAFT_852978 [Rhizoclosmatium globosum]
MILDKILNFFGLERINKSSAPKAFPSASVTAPPAASTTEVAVEKQAFSAIIKEETKTLHRQAENCELIKLIFSARITWPLYLNYLLALYPVYLELEAAMDANKGHPVISRFYFPKELNRASRLEKDIRFLFDGADEDVIQEGLTTRSPAVKAYCDRIRQLSETNPTLLVAHTYSRYLGDLSGGQMIAKRISKSLSLETGAGLDFYEFPDIENHGEFKVLYRGLLDKLDTEEGLKVFLDRDAFIQEAKQSFVFNIGLFEEALPSGNAAA